MTQSNSEDTPSPLIDAAYSTDQFQQLTSLWQQKLTAHLDDMLSRRSKVLNWEDPATLVNHAARLLNDSPGKDDGERQKSFASLMDAMLSSGQNLHNPRYVGHQVPASVPIAGLFDAVGAVTNQPMAIYEMGPWATAVEHALIHAMCKKVGWAPDTSAGLLTSGGSLANLTALLTARNVVFPGSWENGPPKDVALIAHADAHYCVTRSAGILGLGTRQIIKATLDSTRRIDPNALEQTIQQTKNAGMTIMAVVACACATPIGAFDPLTDIADICQRHNTWLHVDAAHGGGVLMSPKHRHLLDGIEKADSLVWDAHKMMFVPALCAAVLYRNKSHQFETFRQDAPYLFDPTNPGLAEYESGMRTLECTKRSLGFSLWGLWSMFGDALFEQIVNHTFDLATGFHHLLTEADDFEPMHVPQANIVAFRYLPDSVRQADLTVQNTCQQQLRSDLIRSGRFYIVQTMLNEKAVLRVTMMNPKTTMADLAELLETIREFHSKAT